MRQLMVKPAIHAYDNCKDFVNAFAIGRGDVILTNKFIFGPYFGELDLEADVIFQEQYGMGEPSDEMAEAIYADMKGPYRRVIAIGGASIWPRYTASNTSRRSSSCSTASWRWSRPGNSSWCPPPAAPAAKSPTPRSSN